MNFSTTLTFFFIFFFCFDALFSATFFHPIHFTDRSRNNKNVFCLLVCKSSFCLFIFYFRSKFVAKKKIYLSHLTHFFGIKFIVWKDKTAYIDVERAKRIIKRIYLPILLLISSKLYLSAVICIYFSWTFGIEFQIASSPSNLPKQSVLFVSYIGILICRIVWHIWMTWRNS